MKRTQALDHSCKYVIYLHDNVFLITWQFNKIILSKYQSTVSILILIIYYFIL